MRKFTNNSNIPLAVAAFLASNTYSFKPNAKRLSATDFTKSVRQITLRNRVNSGELVDEAQDLVTQVKSKNGTAVHDAIERVWTTPHIRENALTALGYPVQIIGRICVNPSDQYLMEHPDAIPVYMEIRKEMEVHGYTISGQFDFVAENGLTDFKTTGTWKFKDLAKADIDYQIQGSIYKVLNPDIITNEHMTIVFWFTDWMENRTKTDPLYPKAPIVPHKVQLMSKEETFRFIENHIAEIERCKDLPEDLLPDCNAKQLWQSDPTYKYYKNPTKRSRSTANFDNFYDAQTRFVKDGAVGVVITVPGKAKACNYCPAYEACTQKDRLIAEGILDTE